MNDTDANDRLAAAERARERVRRSSRWPRWLYIGYAVAGFVYITICGLDVPKGVFWTAFAVWMVAAALLTIYAMRQPVEPHGHRRRFSVTVAIWFLAWMAVFIAGFVFFPHVVAWWVGGAVVTSAIMLAGAWLDAREARR